MRINRDYYLNNKKEVRINLLNTMESSIYTEFLTHS